MGCGSSSQSGGTNEPQQQPQQAPQSKQAEPKVAATSKEKQSAPQSKQAEPKVAAKPKEKQSSPPPAAPAGKPSGNDFLDKGVKAHNALRAKHGAVPLTPAADLTAFSQKWANILAEKDNMEHSSNQMRKTECGGAGENLYYCWSSDPNSGVSAEDATQSWYDEIKDYNFSRPGFAMDTGHFTQVVWKDSKELGMAWSKSKSGSFFVVANYRPAGNFQGDFENNCVAPS